MERKMEYINRDDVLEYINDYIVKNRVADSYEELKFFCEVEGINTTKQQIKSFLRNKELEDGVDLNANFKSSSVDLLGVDKNFIKRSADRFMQEINSSKYRYNSEDLQHFNNLFTIYTKKCLKICSIISMIIGRRIVDRDLMTELDIDINSTQVRLSDIDRLLVPLVHNYILALDVKFNAEQMNTYLKLNIDRVALNKECTIINDCLPDRDLQDYFQISSDKRQFIALTDKQKKEIEEHTIENFKHYLEEDIDT